MLCVVITGTIEWLYDLNDAFMSRLYTTPGNRMRTFSACHGTGIQACSPEFLSCSSVAWHEHLYLWKRNVCDIKDDYDGRGIASLPNPF